MGQIDSFNMTTMYKFRPNSTTQYIIEALTIACCVKSQLQIALHVVASEKFNMKGNDKDIYINNMSCAGELLLI